MTTTNKKKIALFGGTFDPVHTDHLNIAKACKNDFGFDEVWFIPTYQNPFKKEQPAPAKDRLAMLDIVAKQNDFIKVNDYEIKNEITHTIDTVKYFTENFDDEFSLIIGSDQLDKIEDWKDFNELKDLITFKVFLRDEKYNKEVAKKYNFETFTFDNLHLSSTEIRNVERLDLEIPEVNDYINYHLLYLKERLADHMDEKRYIHSLNVGDMAVQLAKQFNEVEWKAKVAGTLHDVTKRWSEDKARKYLEKYLPDLLNEPVPVWHSFTGYLYLKNEWLIKDDEILNAVFNHTVGAPHMSKLDKIIFCADKISKERTYDGVEEYRKLCFEDLDKGFKALIKMQYERAKEKNGADDMGEMLTETYDYYITKNLD